MKRMTRSAHGAVIAIAIALALVAAGPAAAAQPTRTVRPLSGGFVMPAGTACTFDVAGEPTGGFVAETDFSDGSVMYSVRARGAYVNMETGTRYPVEDTWRELDRFDPATGMIVVEAEGQIALTVAPGEAGPFGVGGSNPAFYHIAGTISITVDPDTNHATQFAYSGSVTDVCAALS